MSTPTFPEALDILIQSHIAGIRVALPARVESFDAAKQRVDVQPLVGEGYYDSTNTRQPRRLAMCCDVQVVFPGSGANRITFPINVGDTVLLVFASSSLDKLKGLDGQEVEDPEDDRHHDLSDAIAIPGLCFTPLPDGAYNPEAITVTGPRVVINSSDIRLGGPDAGKRLVTTDEFNGHTHGPGSYVTGTSDVTGTSGGAADVSGASAITSQ